MMNFKWGCSVYVTHFEQQQQFLKQFANNNFWVFTSLHIPEEASKEYVSQADTMLIWLKEHRFKLIVDVSKRTLDLFGVDSVIKLVEKYQIDVLRIDFGYELEEIIKLGKKVPIAFNASTTSKEEVETLVAHKLNLIAIHNFYPRAYTGLSERQFIKMNENFKQSKIQTVAFIANKDFPRGPMFEGLPTLESHRYMNPYVSFLMMNQVKYNCDVAVLSDLMMNQEDVERINLYLTKNIISIVCELSEENQDLYNKVISVRLDSPEYVLRIAESRAYATYGKDVAPYNCITRDVGVITIDNRNFKRYSGEIQIIVEKLPQDDRVNIIGTVSKMMIPCLKLIVPGQKMVFVKPSEQDSVINKLSNE